MIIIGAGMAGLIAASMLRDRCTGVYEAQSVLPDNHSAVLRFRSSVVADTLGIPFKKVEVLRAIEHFNNPIADALSYSRKTNGQNTLRSIVSIDNSFVTRYIAPPDFLKRMQAGVQAPIVLATKLDLRAISMKLDEGKKIISTIPMPALMQGLGWDRKSEFRSVAGQNIIVCLPDTEAYASLYVPEPYFPGARISITGSEMVIECYGAKIDPRDTFEVVRNALHRLGLSKLDITEKGIRVTSQAFGKILPCDEEERRRFIVWASDQFGIYALGRFATWRPSLMLDDCVNDVRVIEKLAAGGTPYAQRLYEGEGK